MAPKRASWPRFNLPKTQEIFKCILDVPHDKLLRFVLLFEKPKGKNVGVCYCIIRTGLRAAAPERHPPARRSHRPGGSGGLTDAGGKGLVPHPPVPAQTRQRAAAVEAVPRVARVQNVGVGEMAVVLDFVAITGDARLLAADKVKTWKGQAQMEAGHTGRSFCGVWRRQRRPLEKTSHSE